MVGTNIIFSFKESSEGGYEARAIGHSIFTQADTFEELRKMAQDAVRCHFESEPLPNIILIEGNPRSSA